MATKHKAVKLSFHIPASEHHVFELIQLVSDVTGSTPSHWVYAAIVKRLTEAGLLDGDRAVVQQKVSELQAALPPGARKKKAAHG